MGIDYMFVNREMLDLNISLVSVDSTWDESEPITIIDKAPQSVAGAQGDDSGTSISSVVNADEAPASTGDTDSSSTIDLDIFNKTKCSSIVNHIQNWDPLELVTRQLFPVTGGERNDGFDSKSSSATSLLRPQWLNLSVPAESVQNPPPDQYLKIFEEQKPQPQPQPRKSRRGPRSRSSQYRGVTFYRRTGRWESHIWDCGKQVYLGGFDTAHAAARAYDRAAVKFRGIDADINFHISDYEDDLKHMEDLTKEEFVHTLRRQSTGFSRGNSKYRGVTLHKNERWDARMGQFLGKKVHDDKAAIECNGQDQEALTNFEPGVYEGKITLLAGDQDKGHNLDLILGISPPTDGLKENKNIRDLLIRDAAYQFPDGKRTKVESSASSPMTGDMTHGLTVASKLLPTRPAMHSGFAQNYEETGIRKMETNLGFSNWAWQTNGNCVVTPVPLFSTAASSGFSSYTTPVFSSSLLPHNTQNKTALKLYLPTPTSETSQFYNHKI